jgi:hypothetical protein
MPLRILLAVLLLLGALVSLGAGAARWQDGGGEITSLAQEKTALETQLDTTRTALHRASLRYQGFQKGMSAVPDTVRRYSGNVIIRESAMHRTTINNLEDTERDLIRRIARTERAITAARESRRRAAVPAGVAGALLLAAGAALLATRRGSRVVP